MSRLIPVERTNDAVQRLAFLENSARSAPALAQRFRPTLSVTEEDPGADADREAVLAQAALFFDCAELAFCIDRTKEGVAYLREAHRELSSIDATVDSLSWRAVSQAVLLEGGLVLNGSQINIGLQKMPWEALGSRAVLVSVLPLLTLAACTRGWWKKTAPYLDSTGHDDPVLHESRAAAFSQPDFLFLRLLNLRLTERMVRFGEDDNVEKDTEAAAFVTVLEAGYTRRINLIISDKFRWKDLRARAGLIDWGLLLVYLLMLRWVSDHFRKLPSSSSEPVNFLRSLAKEIHTLLG